MTRLRSLYVPRPLSAHLYAYPNGERYHMEREAKMYAKAGLGLAKAWRLAAKVEKFIPGFERTRLNNARQADEKAKRKALKQQMHDQRIEAHKQARLQREIEHQRYNAPPYKGRLINPKNWDVPELSPSGGNGRRAVLKARHDAGSSPATGTTNLEIQTDAEA